MFFREVKGRILLLIKLLRILTNCIFLVETAGVVSIELPRAASAGIILQF